MNTRTRLLVAVLCVAASACGGGGGGSGGGGSSSELVVGATTTGALKAARQVDWYHYRAVEAHNVLQVHCWANTYRPDEELSVAVYTEDTAGNRVLLYGDHAVSGSQVPADLKINLYVDAPKDLYVAVRDYQDDEASGKPYYLTTNFTGAAGGNQTFASALTLAPGGAPLLGTVASIGEVDCFRFDVAQTGVYGVDLTFSPFPGGTDVSLLLNLYDADGQKIDTLAAGRLRQARLLTLLRPGSYYVTVEDQGRDHFDLSSSYGVSVAGVPAAEVDQNDDPGRATLATTDPATGNLTMTGALEYRRDRDWYRLALGAPPAGGLRVLELTFAAPYSPQDARFRLDVSDAGGKVRYSRDITPSAGALQAEIRAGSGDHFVRVQEAEGTTVSQAVAYTVLVKVLDVDDPAEAGAGNDTIDTAQPLAPSATQWTPGKIAFRGDEDWFVVHADTSVARILEVYLETDGPTRTNLSLTVLRDGILKKLQNSDGGSGPTRLRTSVYLAPGSPPGPVNFFFRVCDAQGDKADPAVPYRIRCNVVDVPSALPADAAAPGAVYADEPTEQASAETPVKLEVTSLLKKYFTPDTALLKFNGGAPAPGVSLETSGGLTTVRFPWIGGYVDYQGDQDWFELDLEPLQGLGTTPDANWYYDIRVELHVGAPGSGVEYTWKLYRDAGNNRILVDRPGDTHGFFAAAGDTGTGVAPLDLTVPQPGTAQKLWVGDAWAGRFYLSVGDFDFAGSPLPDDDWAYDVPYFFRLTLVYHPGVSHP